MASKHEYPVYIISKGRFKNPLTANALIKSNVKFLIAVEPQEKDEYINALGESHVLVLPFSNLGLGSYPARNFCWEHAKERGYKYHWLFDDNIRGIAKWINGKKKNIEDINSALLFVEKYTNNNKVDISGFEYRYFVTKPPKKPFKLNCHVYSALLIKNDLSYRWRLKYNEDIDLCLQVLHNGGNTASCVYYMTNKVSTVAKMKGGNQDELYKGNAPIKNLLKAKMIEAQWPQYAKTVIRFGRHHHLVDWKVFAKNSNKTEINAI